LLIDVEHDDVRPGQLREFKRCQADWAGADDQARLVRLQRCAIDCMAADGECLHEGELLERELVGHVEFPRRYDEQRTQTAVAMNAERLMFLAAIGVAANTGVTLLTVDVRFDRASIAWPDVGDIGMDIEYLNAELMAWNARVTEEWHLAEVAAEVCAADSHLMDANQGLTRFGLVGRGNVNSLPAPRCFQQESFHEISGDQSTTLIAWGVMHTYLVLLYHSSELVERIVKPTSAVGRHVKRRRARRMS
jgi:hypothetical protein